MNRATEQDQLDKISRLLSSLLRRGWSKDDLTMEVWARLETADYPRTLSRNNPLEHVCPVPQFPAISAERNPEVPV